MKLKALPVSKYLFLILTSVLSLPSNGFGQVCSGCEVSTQTVTKANNLLNLNDNHKDEAEEVHLLGGRPIAPSNATNEHMIHQKEWIAWYDDDLRLPLWVAYELTKAQASAQLTRKDCFRKDPRLSDEVASTCADYQEPIFDRGHMIPNADSKSWSATTN